MSDTTTFPSEEYRIIRKMQSILGNQSSPRFPVTIGDDAAVRVDPENRPVVITTDISVEDVHFSLSYMTIEEAGYRAMVSNISDCAAMGAEPDSAFVQLVVPNEQTNVEMQIEALYRGFSEASTRWDFPVAGGDLSRGTKWVIGITMLGRIEPDSRPLLRKGMLPGDRIYMSGIPGRSAAGLHLLQSSAREAIPEKFQSLVQAHIRPEAQVSLGRYLSRDPHIHAVMDCSDGLSKDCRTLCHENGTGILIDMNTSQPTDEMVELSSETGIPWEQWYLQGGEDYELLFTATPQFDPARCPGNRPVYIGECTSEYTVPMIRSGTGISLVETDGFDHFGMP